VAFNENLIRICLCLNTHIIPRILETMTKTLTIRDEVYEKLVRVKGKDESFSELFVRLVENQSPGNILKALRGSIELTLEQKKEMLADIDNRRKEHRS
jgi:predicted CopG family antitoxin